MKKYFVLALLVFAPVSAHAGACSPHGYTVVYVNGILGVEENAKLDAQRLEDSLEGKYNSEPLIVKTGYNPKKLGGLDDLLKTFIQLRLWKEGVSNNDTDLETILNQLHKEISTQKILLLGHSQGSFYSNEIYEYLLAHGLSKDSVAVYNTGTPATYVAGGGWYLLSTNDRIVDMVRRGVDEDPALYGSTYPVSPNIVIDPHEADGWGHSFSPTYLAKVPDTIVSDIKKTLSKLKATSNTDLPECFVPPSGSLTHKAGVFVSDHALSTSLAAYVAAVGAVKGLGAAAATAASVGKSIASNVGVTVGSVAGVLQAAEVGYKDTTRKVFDSLYGISGQLEGRGDVAGSAQGGAVAMAPVFSLAQESLPLGPVPASVTKTIYLSGQGADDGSDEDQAPDATLPATTTVPATTTPSVPEPDPPAPIPSELAGKLVINEVAWSGTYANPAGQWIEIYNNSSDSVDLATTSLVIDGATTPLSGVVDGHGYMVVARAPGLLQDVDAQQLVVADFGVLGSSASYIQLVDRGGRIIDMTPAADECGGDWCAGSGPGSGYADSTGALPLSMERISPHDDGGDEDSWASNDGYTRRGRDSGGQNIVGTPGDANSKHWPLWAFFCGDEDEMLEPASGAKDFEPASASCTALAGAARFDMSAGGGIFAGVVGSSTQIDSIAFANRLSIGTSKIGQTINSFNPAAGEYFVALWQYNNNVGGGYTANLIPDLQNYLLGGTPSASPLEVVTIPFVIK